MRGFICMYHKRGYIVACVSLSFRLLASPSPGNALIRWRRCSTSTSSREPYRTGSSTSYPLRTCLQFCNTWAWRLQILYFCSLCVKLGILCEKTWRVTRERIRNKCREMLQGTSRILFALPFLNLRTVYFKGYDKFVFDLDPGHSSVESSHHCLIPTTTWCRRRVLTRSAERRSPGWTNTAH